MSTSQKKFCKYCQEDKPVDWFYIKSKTKSSTRSNRCKECSSLYHKQRVANMSPEELNVHRHKDMIKQLRRRIENRASTILTDSKSSDRKRGLVCDMARDYVEGHISKPCTYCGADELLMTLDRIDNSVGHIQGNVVGSCIRCNMVRRNMPISAWMEIAEAMKSARIKGLFGEWTGAIHK